MQMHGQQKSLQLQTAVQNAQNRCNSTLHYSKQPANKTVMNVVFPPRCICTQQTPLKSITVHLHAALFNRLNRPIHCSRLLTARYCWSAADSMCMCVCEILQGFDLFHRSPWSMEHSKSVNAMYRGRSHKSQAELKRSRRPAPCRCFGH